MRAQPALSSIDIMGGMDMDIDMGGMDIAMGSTTGTTLSAITAGDISPSISPSGVLSSLLLRV